MNKNKQKKWNSINVLYPKHKMVGMWHEIYKKSNGSYCSDESPNGWGNFGCKRCQAIINNHLFN